MFKKIVTTHLITLACFFVIYSVVLDFEKHFVASSPDAPLNALSPAYFSVAQHTLLGDNTCLPKTSVSKAIALTHALLAWLTTLGFFFVIL